MSGKTPNADAHSLLYTRNTPQIAGTTVESRLQELIDREEIRELIARYAHRIAQGVSVADMFTDDGAFIVRIPGRAISVARGRDELDGTYGEVAHRTDRPLPMIHNLIIEIVGDDAISVCSNELRASEGGRSMIGSGYYKDRFRREDGRWRFVERDMTFIHWVPIEEGWTRQGPSD